MTYKNIKNRTTTILIAITFAVLIGTMGLTPALADNPPYHDLYWFNYNGDPEVCYLENELDDLTVDGVTDKDAEVITAVELTRAEYNSEINGLTIGAEQTSCSYNRIEIGAIQVPGSYIAQTVLTAYWCCSNFGQYAEKEFDFDLDTDWEIESNDCSIWNDKDPEYIANHEFGHALSINHHTGTDHSVMKGDCSQKWSGVQTVDEAALEVRYN